MRDKLVLDFGCGTGALSVALANRGARVVSVDPTWLSLKATRLRGKYFDLSERELMPVQVSSRPGLPLKRGSFDLVITNSVLEFIPLDRRSYVHNLLSLLKPGGHLVISTENGLFPIDYYTRRPFLLFRRQWAIQQGIPYGLTYFELLRWVRDSGYRVVNLSARNYFNSVDKLIRRQQRTCDRSPLMAALLQTGAISNQVFKRICSLLRFPSDLCFPYNTFILQCREPKSSWERSGQRPLEESIRT